MSSLLQDHLREVIEALKSTLENAARAKASQDKARAALAFVERLAGVGVALSVQGGVVESRVFAEARTPAAYGASLLHVWQREDHDQAEVEAVAHLAAALECRRQAGEVAQ